METLGTLLLDQIEFVDYSPEFRETVHDWDFYAGDTMMRVTIKNKLIDKDCHGDVELLYSGFISHDDTEWLVGLHEKSDTLTFFRRENIFQIDFDGDNNWVTLYKNYICYQ